jgi:hypothetical protein
MSTKDRYVSFENIDCYNNAQAVLEAMEELFSLHVDAKNEFWERFLSKLPDDYKNNPIDEGGDAIRSIRYARTCFILRNFLRVTILKRGWRF